MKKILLFLLVIVFIFTACAAPSIGDETVSSGSTDTVVSNVSSDETISSEAVSKDEISSEAVSSEAVSSEAVSSEAPPYCDESLLKEIDGIKYYDVKASGAYEGIEDHSEYFPEEAEGYYLDELTFLVDEETFRMICQKPCTGTGAIKWKDFDSTISWDGNDWFDGILPADKVSDPMYRYICVPSERSTIMNRINASNMSYGESRFTNLMAIAAVYPDSTKQLPDDAEFTLCFGRVGLILNTEEKGWHIAKEFRYPLELNRLYYLPWELESVLGTYKLPQDRIKFKKDVVEVKLTGADLNGAHGRDKGAIGNVLHFWGQGVKLDGGKVRALATCFTIWIKEPEWADYLSVAVAADWRDSNGKVYQAFASHNYAVTTEPRVMYGHTVGPQNYDKLMDSEKLQKLLGLK